MTLEEAQVALDEAFDTNDTKKISIAMSDVEEAMRTESDERLETIRRNSAIRMANVKAEIDARFEAHTQRMHELLDIY